MNVCLLLATSSVCALVPLTYSASGQDVRNAREKQARPVERQLETLNNTRWYLTVKPDQAASELGLNPFPDVMVFQKDKVLLTACLARGFAPSPVELRAEEGGINVRTEQSSPKEGKTRWEAVIRGKDITGNLAWTNPDGKVSHFTFAGKESTVLEATTWTVRLVPEDETYGEAMAASLVFESGKLYVKDMAQKSFDRASYSLTGTGALRLVSTLVGIGEEETLSIDALIEGKSIRGTAELASEEDQWVVYTLPGRLARDAASIVKTN